jgi:hypothetical protein
LVYEKGTISEKKFSNLPQLYLQTVCCFLTTPRLFKLVYVFKKERWGAYRNILFRATFTGRLFVGFSANSILPMEMHGG